MLYVTGDTHGDYERFTSSALKKLKKGDTLFICGDFGFIWDGSKNEEKMLKKIGKLKYNVCFIDGTHENFELLRSYEVSEFKGGKVHHITGNLYHLMRGQTYDFDGVSSLPWAAAKARILISAPISTPGRATRYPPKRS